MIYGTEGQRAAIESARASELRAIGAVASVACPACGAAVGSWCVRHGQTQPGPLLACVARVRLASA